MKLIIQRENRKAQYYPEDLGNGITLDMVLIPGGTFLMGSPQDELERSDSESPQHEVTVPPFFMGKYPVTQAQWQAVVALPKVNQDLEPGPSEFKGANRPVESVSWHDATEFCRRLAQKTGRPYRLPSEAEWEYACRAETTTPFPIKLLSLRSPVNLYQMLLLTPSIWESHQYYPPLKLAQP